VMTIQSNAPVEGDEIERSNIVHSAVKDQPRTTANGYMKVI